MDDVPSFFQLLDEHFDIAEFIPSVFTNAFYQQLGRKRIYPLTRQGPPWNEPSTTLKSTCALPEKEAVIM